MVKRFLDYSLAHGRPVKALFADTMKYRNITVTALDDAQVTYTVAGKKTPLTSPIGDILSAGYARGDDGDTLKYAVKEQEHAVLSHENQGENAVDPER